MGRNGQRDNSKNSAVDPGFLRCSLNVQGEMLCRHLDKQIQNTESPGVTCASVELNDWISLKS